MTKAILVSTTYNLICGTLAAALLASCSGTVATDTLGLTSARFAITQNDANGNLVKINLTDSTTRLKVRCQKEVTKLAASFDNGTTWSTVATVACNEEEDVWVKTSRLDALKGAESILTNNAVYPFLVKGVSETFDTVTVELVAVKPSFVVPAEPVRIEGGNQYTNKNYVSINASVEQQVKNLTQIAAEAYVTTDPTCSTGGAWVANAGVINGVYVPISNSTNLLSIKFRDEAWNESSCLSDTIIHDNAPPFVPPGSSMAVNAEDPTTPNLNLTATQSGIVDVTIAKYFLATESASNHCDGQPFLLVNGTSGAPYPATHSFTAPGSYTEGATLYFAVIYEDQAGNKTTCYKDSIIFDAEPPPAPGVALAATNPIVDRTVNYTVQSLGAAQRAIYFSSSSICPAVDDAIWATLWQNTTTSDLGITQTESLSTNVVANGTYHMHGRLKDPWGKISNCTSTSSFVINDTTLSGLSLQINNLTNVTGSQPHINTTNLSLKTRANAAKYVRFVRKSNNDCNIDNDILQEQVFNYPTEEGTEQKFTFNTTAEESYYIAAFFGQGPSGNVTWNSTCLLAGYHLDTTAPMSPTGVIIPMTKNQDGVPTITQGSDVQSPHLVVNVAGLADADFFFIKELNSSASCGAPPAPSDTGWNAKVNATGFSFTINDTTQGDKRLHVWAKDLAGNISSTCHVHEFALDTVAPSLSFVQINNGAEFTNSQAVSLRFLGQGATLYQVTEGNFCSGLTSWSSLSPAISDSNSATRTVSHTLSSASPFQSLSFRLKDNAGNMSSCLTAAITLDQNPPILNGIHLQGRKTKTNDPELYIHWDITDSTDVTKFQIDKNPTFNGATNKWDCVGTWFNLTSGQFAEQDTNPDTFVSGNGEKTIGLRLMDHSGNLSDCKVDSIVIDTVGPQMTSFVINNDADTSLSPFVTLNPVFAENPSDATLVKLKIGSCPLQLDPGVAWSAGQTFDLGPLVDNTNYTVFAQFVDDEGNTGNCLSDSIVFDSDNSLSTAPSGMVAGGQTYINSENNVVMNLVANSSTYLLYGIGESQAAAEANANNLISGNAPFTTTANLSGTEGLKTVYFAFKKTDNSFVTISDEVILDKTGPVIQSFSISNSKIENAWNPVLSFTINDTNGGLAISGVKEIEVFENGVRQVTLSWTGSLSPYTYALTDTTMGNKQISIFARDFAGNSTTSGTLNFYYNPDRPATPDGLKFSSNDLTTISTNNSSVGIYLSGSIAGNLVYQLYRSSTQGGTYSTVNPNPFSPSDSNANIDISGSAEGTQYYKVKLKNQYTELESDSFSNSIALTKDITAPVLTFHTPIFSNSDSSKNCDLESGTYYCKSGDALKLIFNSTELLATTPVDSKTLFSNGLLSGSITHEGGQQYSARVVVPGTPELASSLLSISSLSGTSPSDAAGNSATLNTSPNVTNVVLDNVAPTIPTPAVSLRANSTDRLYTDTQHISSVDSIVFKYTFNEPIKLSSPVSLTTHVTYGNTSSGANFPCSIVGGNILECSLEARLIASGQKLNLSALLNSLNHNNITDLAGNTASAPSSSILTYIFNICPTNYVPVGANTDYTIVGTGFCVAKYEMKNISGTAVSQANGSPWTSIIRGASSTSLNSAWKACQDIGSGYDLISNAQWQTMAREIELNSINWQNNQRGHSGGINTGHSDNSPGNALAANSDDSQACTGTGQSCNSSTWNAQRRTHRLKDGHTIWDVAGNVWEWVRDSNSASISSSYIRSIFYWSSLITIGGINQTYNFHFGPKYDYTSLGSSPYGGLGYIHSGNRNALRRGGDFNNNDKTGIFGLSAADNNNESGANYGFRCVWTAPP